MGIIVPLNYAQCVIRWGLLGDPEPMVCTLGVGPLVGEAPEDIASEVYLDISGTGAPCSATNMSTSYSLLGVTCYRQTADGFDIGNHDDVLQGVGNVNPLPSNCAYLVKKNTSIGGRRNRGRMFVPPFMDIEGNVSAIGQITANIAVLQARWDTFYTNLTASGIGMDLSPVLFHSDGGSPTPITGFTLASLIATQRTRMRG